jgi:hypothetical protein
VSSTVTRSSATLMEEAAGSVRARKGLGRPFIGKRGEKDRHDEQGFGLRVLQGGEDEPQRLGGDSGAGEQCWQCADAMVRRQGANRGG